MARVHYDDDNWEMIQMTLRDKSQYLKIHISTRVRLISDMFVLAEAGEIRYRTLFTTMDYLNHEQFFRPWKVALDEFALIRRRLMGTIAFESYQTWIGEILKLAFQEFLLIDKFWDLHYQRRKLRIAITEASCLYEVHTCVEKSLNIIENWSRTPGSEPKWPSSIPHAVTTIIHCQKAKRNNDYWKKLWKQFSGRNASDVVQGCILEALGCSRDTRILKKYLERSINPKKISQSESLKIFQSLTHNDKGYDVMKDFLMDNYDRIRRFHAESKTTVIQYLKTLLNITTKKEDFNSLIDFATTKNLDLKNSSVKRSIASSRRHFMWYPRHRLSVLTYFQLPLRT